MCSSSYLKNYLYMTCIILVLAGGLNWGLVGIFDFNLVKTITYYPVIEKIVYILVALATLALIFRRDTYLPFLGETVYPVPLKDIMPVITDINMADTLTLSNIPANTKVVYWASLPSHKHVYSNPRDAYGNYMNSGVGTTDKDGNLTITINSPSKYKVGMFNRTLHRHIHYRYWKCNGMLSDVYTANL